MLSLKGTHILLGDFNTHVNDSKDKTALNFLQLTDSYNWKQHVNIPTHNLGNTLDLILTHANISVSNLRTDHSVPSDHYALLFDISYNHMKYDRSILTLYQKILK